MKTKVFSVLFVISGFFLLFNSLASATTYVRVGVGVGGGYGYGYGCYPYYRPYWGAYYPYGPAYYAPTVIYTTPIYSTQTVYTPISTTTETTVTRSTSANTQAPAPAPAPAPTNRNTTSAPPYGIPANDCQVKSPFSNFVINDTGMKSGTTVYDAYTGQPFRIP